MKVSKRERSLLFFLLFITTISLAIVLVIMPLQASIDTQKSLNTDLKSQKVLIDAQITAGAGLDTKIQKTLDDVSAAYVKIESPQSSEEFEQRLLPFFVLNNINITSWVVEDTVITSPNLPTYVKFGDVYKIKELVDNYLGTQASTKLIPVTDTQLVMTRMNFSFTSSYPDFMFILNTISTWNSTVYISSSSRDYNTGEATISIDFYSIEKP